MWQYGKAFLSAKELTLKEEELPARKREGGLRVELDRGDGELKKKVTLTYTCSIVNQLLCLNLLETAKFRCKSFAFSDYWSLHSGTIPDRLEEVRPGQDG